MQTIKHRWLGYQCVLALFLVTACNPAAPSIQNRDGASDVLTGGSGGSGIGTGGASGDASVGDAGGGSGGGGGTDAHGTGGMTGAGGTGTGARAGSGGASGMGGASGTGGAGGRGGGSGTGGFGGTMGCSAIPLVACPSGRVCDYDTPNRCAAGFEPGHCIVLPTACLAIYDPVCGCNGQTYSSDCVRQSARVQLDHAGACSGQGGAGGGGGANGTGCAACNAATNYCQVTSGGAVGIPPSYVCRALPAGCGASPSCACLAGAGCGQCTISTNGVLTLTCLVP
jgi:hypothetical protein